MTLLNINGRRFNPPMQLSGQGNETIARRRRRTIQFYHDLRLIRADSLRQSATSVVNCPTEKRVHCLFIKNGIRLPVKKTKGIVA